MSSIAMYNSINAPGEDIFVAAAIVLITLATANLILQVETLKQIVAVQEQEQPAIVEAEAVAAPLAEAQAEPLAEAQAEPLAEAPVQPTVIPYPTIRPRGVSKTDYIRHLQTYRGPAARKMLTRPVGMTKDNYIEALHKLIKLADQANKWRQNNPEKEAARRLREKQKRAAVRAAGRRLTFR